jgi:DHA1 family tetracycline resistance protein-like MFS transporter
MRRLIFRVGEKRMLFLSLISYIIVFLIYPYLNELWMIYLLMLPYGFGMATIGPLISSNITKATGPDKQGRVSGWSTNFSAISQTLSPFISSSFFQIGGLAISFIFFSPVQLIGLTNVLLGITLLIILYADVKIHPKLYAYERIRKKHKEVKKRRIKEQDKNQISEPQEIIE